MRLLAASLLLAGRALAWDTPPHRAITRAALDALPASLVQRFGSEAAPLVNLYCIYPDLFQEMDRFGFVRKSPGPRSASEIRAYCMRPDGELVHGATGEREADLASLVFLFERIASSLQAQQIVEAAKYAGVLSHFVSDSLSPPHAVSPERLRELEPWLSNCGRINIHAAIERSLPPLTLEGRAPQIVAANWQAAAAAILDRCYAGAERNRKDLPAMVRAACGGDERALDPFRRRAGTEVAAILADALYTAMNRR